LILFLIPNDDIQRFFWVPDIGRINAFTILLEVDNINGFEDIKHFFSSCQLTPATRNSDDKSKQRSSKDGNRYLKVQFSDAAFHACKNYLIIRNYHNSLLRKRNKHVAKTIIAKEIAEIVYHV